jgi:hypothetical protein
VEASLASMPAASSNFTHETGALRRNDLQRKEAAMRVTRAMFEELSNILLRLRQLARQELADEPQSIDDGLFLKSLHWRFKSLAFNRSNSDEAQTSMALVSDPATEYSRQECFEIAVGQPHAIYVAVPDAGRTFVCRGAVYSFYSFTRPIEQRLDDNAWRAQLKSGTSLPPAWWDARPELRPAGRGIMTSRP